MIYSVPGFSNASESVDPNPQISEASATAPVRNIVSINFSLICTWVTVPGMVKDYLSLFYK